MRFAYAESMCDPAFYSPLARAAEAAGFDTYLVPDSVCYPEHSSASYPYTPDGLRQVHGVDAAFEPMLDRGQHIVRRFRQIELREPRLRDPTLEAP
jgi:alkanesulfonate monooxygenase SsuD/methylene tetrahydromethanopterin reductase-like flavin-dependent oxidoreductase (luciferase family)